MAVPATSPAYGAAFEQLLLRTAVGTMVSVAGTLGDKALVAGITIGDDLYGLPERDRLRIVQECAARLARDARRDGLPPMVLTVYGYGTRGLHAHLVAIVKPSRVASYRRSKTFRPYIRGNPADAIKRANDHYLWNYLPKNLEEPGPITGGRLRLSADLKRRLVGSGRVPPFSTPQLRFEPAGIPERPVSAPTFTAVWTDNTGQIRLFAPQPRREGSVWRQLREAMGLPQGALGALIGVTQSALAHVENDDNGIRPLHARRVLCLAHERLGRARVDAIIAGECDAAEPPSWNTMADCHC